ncbi:MAG: PEP-CTERM sorting domain-containing protein [Acidiferrobacteraceae bacterium]
MEIKLKKLLYGGCVGLLLSSSAHAASVSYFLNENNAGLPANHYGVVTLSDLTGGGVRFTVTPENLTPDSNFGIQNFGFNSSLPLSNSNYTLPSRWSFVAHGQNTMAGYGSFDDIINGKGYSRQDPLTFSVNIGTIADYQFPNTPNGSYFVAHIADFSNGEPGNSGYFASDITPVPEANVWAMMSVGLAALGLRLRRKRA